MTQLRVLAAMSGGVDSAVAAARAADAGHQVTGVHLALSANPRSYRTGARGCCTLEDARDARRAADVIGIPFYVWDMADRFDRDVVSDFVAEYAAGRTPNPCLRCNEKIKFTAVLDRAVALGFDAVCTGHHARLHAEPGRTVLRRSVDPAKDQSYVLAVLTAGQLGRAMFPLGGSTKEQVRREAAARGLAVAGKPDSHDVCFIADGDTRGFLARRLGAAPGPIVDTSGQVLGRHDGAYGFTVGQRKGLRIGRPAADGRPRYVLDIEPVSGTVTVGPAERLDVHEITAAGAVWTGCVPPTGPRDCAVQLRAHGEAHPATALAGGDGTVLIRLHEPARGVASGQAAVLYDGDLVLGSATVTAARAAARALYRYSRLVRRLPYSLAWFDAEHDVLRTAVALAAAAGFHAHAWPIPQSLISYFDWRGHWHDWVETQLVALDAAQRAGDQAGLAFAHFQLGRVYRHLGHESAESHLTEALSLWRERGDPARQADVLHALSTLRYMQDRCDEAVSREEHVLSLYRQTGHRYGEANALNNLGWLHVMLGQREQAIARAQDAIDLSTELGYPFGEAQSWDTLGFVWHVLDDHAQAIACFKQALALCRGLGTRYYEAVTLTHLGDTHQAAGDQEAAGQAWRRALRILEGLHHTDASRVRGRLDRITRPPGQLPR